jgi:hypothetical protein
MSLAELYSLITKVVKKPKQRRIALIALLLFAGMVTSYKLLYKDGGKKAGKNVIKVGGPLEMKGSIINQGDHNVNKIDDTSKSDTIKNR